MIERDVFHAVMPKGHPLAAQRHGEPQGAGAGAVDRLRIDEGARPSRHGHARLPASRPVTPAGAGGDPSADRACLVESGLGVALVPSVSARFASKNLVFRPVRGLPASASIGIAIAFHAENETAAARRLREVARELSRAWCPVVAAPSPLRTRQEGFG